MKMINTLIMMKKKTSMWLKAITLKRIMRIILMRRRISLIATQVLKGVIFQNGSQGECKIWLMMICFYKKWEFNLLVLQNFTIAQKSGNILFTYYNKVCENLCEKNVNFWKFMLVCEKNVSAFSCNSEMRVCRLFLIRFVAI